MLQVFNLRDARQHLADIVNRALGGDDVVIERRGRRDVVLIRYEDYVALREELAVLRACREAEAVYEAYLRDPSLAVPYEEARRGLVDEGLLDE